MSNSASYSTLGSEFDAFLFSPIGEDRNDTPISVLSALARLDIDPWQEAAELARLPRETATQRLASLIAALSDGSVHLEHGKLAARLIARLPRQGSSAIPSRDTVPDAGDVTKFRAGVYLYVVFIAFMLAAQWIAASGHTPAAVENAAPSASSAVVPQTPTSNSDP